MSFYSVLQRILPSVKDPVKVPPVKKKLIWTGIVLVLFFILGTIPLLGLSPAALQQLTFYQMVTASNIGTLISLGIGPIVLASIILQLLVGVKIINLNFSNTEDRAKFSLLQKFCAIILSIVEAIVMVTIGWLQPLPGMWFPLVLQVTFGSIILLYLDEVVSKYGIGSGIGLFIAAGVSQEILWRIFAIPSATYGGGLLFTGINYLKAGEMISFLSQVLLPIAITIGLFFLIVYLEGVHVNIPLTIGRSGMGAKYPVKLLYVSNMPVILTTTLFANIGMFAQLAKTGKIAEIMGAVSKVITPQYNLIQNTILGSATGTMWLYALIYMVLFVGLCVIFGKFWIQVGGQGPENVAKQLQSSGMSIPGFRRDERVLTSVLQRYIPVITVLGSIFVGLLAFASDLVGAIGGGIGILLTVGIIYRLYEQLAREQVFESSSFLKKFVGKGGQ
ncbi:MAG TPA: preprotein translocase subunit SecY [archaeon]|jgi:preprotein translocase subunit SecY|nr:preprotein translocase subunit SecY [archaeon]HRT02338.1 preprotein translocase subunit SecY [Candidatus Diapherotrites archaeon]